MKLLQSVSLFIILVFLIGCETYNNGQYTRSGMAIGSVVGGVTGALAGLPSPPWGGMKPPPKFVHASGVLTKLSVRRHGAPAPNPPRPTPLRYPWEIPSVSQQRGLRGSGRLWDGFWKIWGRLWESTWCQNPLKINLRPIIKLYRNILYDNIVIYI